MPSHPPSHVPLPFFCFFIVFCSVPLAAPAGPLSLGARLAFGRTLSGLPCIEFNFLTPSFFAIFRLAQQLERCKTGPMDLREPLTSRLIGVDASTGDDSHSKPGRFLHFVQATTNVRHHLTMPRWLLHPFRMMLYAPWPDHAPHSSARSFALCFRVRAWPLRFRRLWGTSCTSSRKKTDLFSSFRRDVVNVLNVQRLESGH